MRTSENFFNYFLEKRKNIKHFFLFKIQFFPSVIEIKNIQFSKKLNFRFVILSP